MKKKPIKHHFQAVATPEEIHAFNQNPAGLHEILATAENYMSAFLYAANLPVIWRGPYAPVDLVLRKQLEGMGVDWESREGYAARILYQCWLVRTSGGDARAIHAMCLGSLITESTMHHPWEIGFAVSSGGKKGAERRGSPAERLAENEKLRALYVEVRAKCASKSEAYKIVAKRAGAGVAIRKVRRAVTGH